jgi:hypothetical protein
MQGTDLETVSKLKCPKPSSTQLPIPAGALDKQLVMLLCLQLRVQLMGKKCS